MTQTAPGRRGEEPRSSRGCDLWKDFSLFAISLNRRRPSAATKSWHGRLGRESRAGRPCHNELSATRR